MHDVIRVVSARYRHDAIVTMARFLTVRLDDRFQTLPAGRPVERVLLFVNAAARADVVRIERKAQWMASRVEAARTELLRHRRQATIGIRSKEVELVCRPNIRESAAPHARDNSRHYRSPRRLCSAAEATARPS